MIKIKNGLTNKSFKDGKKFVQIIIKNKFNHNLDYSHLAIFDFVPKLIEQTSTKLTWEFIEGKRPQITNKILKQIGKMMRQIHLSNIKLPSNNLLSRTKNYLKIINDKKIHIPEIHDNFIQMNKLMKNMGKLNPCHNDIWANNLVEDNNKKIWLVDWEYSTMGDKHFDIAYFIETSALDKNQEKIFLKAYSDYQINNHKAYQIEILPKYKKLVNYIVILWLHAQDKMFFSDKKYREAMHK